MKKLNDTNRSIVNSMMAGLVLLILVLGCDNVLSPQLTDSENLPVSESEAGVLDSETDDPISTVNGFYFLPPMVKNSEFSGTFDPGLSPVVEICETPACESLHASFDVEGQGPERVRMVEEDEHYIVNWNTRRSGASAGQTYRIRVLVGGFTLGHADVHVVQNGSQANGHREAGEIAIVANQTLPVKFRVETGIVRSIIVSPSEASVNAGGTQQYEAELLDLHGEPVADPEITWSSDDTDVATVDADGLATGIATGLASIIATSGSISGSGSLEVTAGSTGILTGRVVDADNGEVIEGAFVDLGGDNNSSTNAEGVFSFELPEGDYNVSVSMSGYTPAEIAGVQVLSGETNDLGDIALSPVETGDPGMLTGRVVDALDGVVIEGALVDLGGNNSTNTNSQGLFSFELPEGDYNVSVSMPGYLSAEIAGVQVISGETNDLGNIALSPVLGSGEVRIVLTWGETPRDLDAILTGPIPGSDDRFRVWWQNRGSLTSTPFAFLDRDVTNSFGPETTTISQQFDGVYRYSVHDFTNRFSETSAQLGASNARVRVYDDTGQVAEFQVPSEPGTLWTVFELDGLSGNITPVNEMTFISNGSDVMSLPQQKEREGIREAIIANPKP